MRRGLRSKRKHRARSSATSPDGASSTCKGPAAQALRRRHRPPADDRGSGDGIVARQREVKALVELRVPFELDRQAIDDVERGANDSDWQPAKDAARQIAFAEDGAMFEGYAAAGIVASARDQQSES
jgi:uncharacterized linocin/CFP29 family protein